MFNFLFVSTGWFSYDGGIQTVNRELCKQLSKNNKVCVLLTKDANKEEESDARSNNVELLSEIDLKEFIENNSIDFVCTHASFTGLYIDKIKKIYEEINKSAPKFIHFIHHDPEEVENYKETIRDKQVARNTKKAIEVSYASQADGVMAIGRKLREEYKKDIIATNHQLRDKIKYINCGISKDNTVDFIKTTAPEVLVSGRTSSLMVKGIDFFSKAVSKLKIRDHNIKYIIRGEDGDLEHLHKYLTEEYEAPKNINIKPYTTDDNELQKDKMKATLSILPSREDGFGLSAAETISLNIPTIVSINSGIGQLIDSLNEKEIDKDIKRRFVWDGENVGKLRKQIKKCLENQQSSYDDVSKLREALYKVSSWEGAAKKFLEYCEMLLGIELMKNEEDEISLFMQRKMPYLRLYDISLSSAQERIDLLSITFSKLRKNHGELIIEKAKNIPVRIALLDPCFPIPHEENSIAAIREKEENMDNGEIRKSVAAWHEDIWQKRGDDSKLEIRLFRALPTINMILTDNKMFIGLFLLNEDETAPTFIVEKNHHHSMGHKLFEAHLQHFEFLWNSGRSRSFDKISSEEIEAWKSGKILG